MKIFLVATSLYIVTTSCETPSTKRPAKIRPTKPKPKPRPSQPLWKVDYKKNEFNELTNHPESVSNSFDRARLNIDLISAFDRFRGILSRARRSAGNIDSQRQKLPKELGFTNYIVASRQVVVIYIIGAKNSNITLADNPVVAIRDPRSRRIIRLRGVKGELSARSAGVVYVYGTGAQILVFLMRTCAYSFDVSLQGFDEYYVTTVYCKFFNDAWQKTGW